MHAVREVFGPTTSDLSPSNSVLLPILDVPSYLDKALIVLGLHVEARTSFITYANSIIFVSRYVDSSMAIVVIGYRSSLNTLT